MNALLAERRTKVKKAERKQKTWEKMYRGMCSGLKDKYGDIVLMLKLGQFYYAYMEDAEICHRVLGREYQVGSEMLSPSVLVGMEGEAMQKSIAELFEAGFKVGMLGQVDGCTVIAESGSEEVA